MDYYATGTTSGQGEDKTEESDAFTVIMPNARRLPRPYPGRSTPDVKSGQLASICSMRGGLMSHIWQISGGAYPRQTLNPGAPGYYIHQQPPAMAVLATQVQSD
ncbi:hypothetical protein MHUMG1_01183 [Metarhizium humberi]|uniref:Uncharacterized protein n=1 Tax=Metarhizium humberi TaxID=2596975 RepID=A0A9P8MH49_9HYPO|nr:hypothetical protein MHUMG1_01183 [Metarhizium humberi]